jgi:hypothetical protein
MYIDLMLFFQWRLPYTSKKKQITDFSSFIMVGQLNTMISNILCMDKRFIMRFCPELLRQVWLVSTPCILFFPGEREQSCTAVPLWLVSTPCILEREQSDDVRPYHYDWSLLLASYHPRDGTHYSIHIELYITRIHKEAAHTFPRQ